MAEKTDTPKVHQHLLSDDERSKWTVVDIAVVSPTSVTALLQNNQEWCIDTFDYDENEYQRSKRICLQTNLKEPPLLLSYVYVENKLKHFVSTKMKLHLIDDESESIEKSVSLSAEPSALCVEDNKVYISTNETKTLMFFKLELPTDTSKIYLKGISEHDSIAEFVVHSKNIYVCTKGGKVSSHKETGEKQHDYRNRKSKNSKARGLAVFTPQGKDSNLLLVTWSDNTLYIYSTKSHHDLLDIDFNVPGKIRVTTSCFLMSSEVNDVAVYNMKTVADRGAFKMMSVSGSREEELSYLINYVLHDATAPFSRNFFMKRKILATLIEMYDYSCITNDNLNAENKKLKHDLDRSKKEKDDVTEELKNTRTNLSRKEEDFSNVKAKLDRARAESDELRRMNEEKEDKCDCLTKQLESERKTTEEAENARKALEQTKAMLEKEKEYLTKLLAAEERNETEMKKSLAKATTSCEKLQKAYEILQKEKEDLSEQLSTEKSNSEIQIASFSKISITKHNESMKSSLLHIRSVIDKTLSEINEHRTLQVNQLDSVHEKKYNEDLEGTTSSRRTVRTSRFLQKMQKRLSRENKSMSVEKRQQEEFGYTTDSTTDNESTSGYETASEFEWERPLSPGSAAKIQHDEPGITTDPATQEHRSYVSDDTSDTDTVKGDSDEEEVLDGQSKLEVCARVSVEGANLKIAETGVSLFIPPGALSEEQTIHMKIIPQPCDAKAALKFECNSVVVVELLPNHCRFQCPVSLTLPHCLQLKEEYERNSIDVLISHHEEGLKPKWEILHDAKFYLWKENCTISLHSFCWVTYEIHDTIVEAKRIKLYTAGKKMRLKDRITEVEVGFYPDLPGSGKILELNKDMHLSQRKPYVFLKTGEEPLLINLHKVVPKEWNNSQPDENPKIIPFDSVSISEERSCPFVLERSGDDTDIPLCIFKVGQKGRNEVELTIRPDVLTA